MDLRHLHSAHIIMWAVGVTMGLLLLSYGAMTTANNRDVPSTLAGVIGELSPPLVSPRVLAGEGSSNDPVVVCMASLEIDGTELSGVAGNSTLELWPFMSTTREMC